MHLTCNERYKENAEAMDKINNDYWESIKDNPNLAIVRERYFLCKCEDCELVFSSEYAAGGGQIADTGDYDDIYCPKCLSLDLDDNYTPCEVNMTNWKPIEELTSKHETVLLMNDAETYDIGYRLGDQVIVEVSRRDCEPYEQSFRIDYFTHYALLTPPEAK